MLGFNVTTKGRQLLFQSYKSRERRNLGRKEVGKIPQFVRFSTIKYRFLGLKPQYRNPFQGGALIRKPVFYTNFQT